jgi:hypothetical protein
MNEIRVLSLILQTPNCLPPLIHGDFGIGKTSRVEQLAHGLDWDVEVLRPAERGEGALGVVPVPSEDRKVLHYPLPDWANRLATSNKPALIFLDEVSSCPPALQPAIMGLALDGVIAGQRLPKHVRRCAAGNPVDQAAGGWDLAPALANRFVHLAWSSPKADEWTNWLTGNADAERVHLLDMDKWEKEWGQAKALGAAFVRAHPGVLQEDVGKVLGRTPPAYTTPRTWEAALRLLATCRATNTMDLYATMATGSIGPAMALEGPGGDPHGAWLVWLKDNDLPDPEDLLADPGLFDHDAKRPDRSYATLLAVAEAGLATMNGKKLSPEKRAERWENAFAVMYKALDLKLGKDVVLLPARILCNAERRPKCVPQKAARKVCDVLRGFIDLVELPGVK